MKKGFNNEQYVKLQTEVIEERIKMFNGKLYLEFGGKLFDDYHAQRILPGFELNSKIRLLEKLKDSLEIIFCINAGDIARKKIRADYGITYDMELIRLVKVLTKKGLKINSVAINLYDNQPGVDIFEDRLHSLGIKTYLVFPLSVTTASPRFADSTVIYFNSPMRIPVAQTVSIISSRRLFFFIFAAEQSR